jgi:chemotaxis signal transduction protein
VKLMEFESRGARFGLPLACVRRAVPSAQPAPLPGAADLVLGVLNVAGELVTVIDFARRLGAPAAPIRLAQQLLIVEAGGFLLGLLVDRIHGVAERAAPAQLAVSVRAGARALDSIALLDDGLCMIVDPEKFLFEEEQAALLLALAEMAVG